MKTDKEKIFEIGAWTGKADDMYNTIDYKDAFNHIRKLADLEWNGMITVTELTRRMNEVITVISEKESK